MGEVREMAEGLNGGSHSVGKRTLSKKSRLVSEICFYPIVHGPCGLPNTLVCLGLMIPLFPWVSGLNLIICHNATQ